MVLKKYILKSIGEIFFPFFFVLFFLASIILLLNIAVLTSGIKLDSTDLMRLYYYGMPGSLFFVIAITFYSACILGLSRISYDSEMLVLFSLGFSPSNIIKFLLPISILASLTLAAFSFIMTPITKNSYRDFIAYKASMVDIDIKPGNFGQKIGDWLIYVDEKDGDTYKGLVLYSNSGNETRDGFIIAQSGEIINEDGILELVLLQGETYFGENGEIQRIHFDKMIVKNELNPARIDSGDVYEYWREAFAGNVGRMRTFVQYLSTSLLPIASIFLILFFGIRNPRFQKNRSYFYVISSGAFYLITMYSTSLNSSTQPICAALPFMWFIMGYYLYKKYVKRFY